MRISDLSFKQRFLLIGATFVLGYVALVFVAGTTLMKVMVNGPLYQEVAEDKDVIADILPPPKFILEADSLTYKIAAETDPAKRRNLVKKFEKAHEQYLARHAFWVGRLEDRELREELMETSHGHAVAFFRTVDKEFFPAVEAGNKARVSELLAGDLAGHFSSHRFSIEKAVGLARDRIEAREAEADRAVTRGRALAIGVTVAFILIVSLVSIVVMRSILTSVRAIQDRMRQMAEADADLSTRLNITSKDEVGELARWIDKFVDKIAALVRAVKRSSISLRSTATEMAATSHEQEATVSSFGASTTQIAAAVKEITATGTELLTTMNEVGQVARDSAAIAVEGRTSLADMQSSMGSLAGSSASISSKLEAIREKARDITGVVTTITRVADQTNLLSVNAAIEAEKAGEYGRGFLVVAREIRRLADQTASATLDIEHTVQQMQGAVSTGVMEMDKFSAQVRRSVEEVEGIGAKLAQIIERVEVLTDRFGHVSEGMSSQNVGARQINEAMAGLTENVKTTARSLSEFTSAAEEMKGAVEGLKGELGRFKLED
jgi:methyl-accepting chemotaxis protein WspA